MAAKPTYRILTACGFAAATALYFINDATHVGGQAVDCIAKTLPLLLLSAAALAARREGSVLLPAALLLSAAGDLAGECGAFLWQISAFAVAHMLFSAYFLKRASRPDAVSAIAAALFIAAGASVWAYLFRHIHVAAEAAFCTFYIIVIVFMAVSATLQRCRRKWWYVASAGVFMFSDACIAWNRFIATVPHSSEIIMATYFAAQFAFAYLYLLDEEYHPDKRSPR